MTRKKSSATEYFDVIVVGAGISGIGSAWYLQRECPKKSFVLLEALGHFGGTWHIHRYPGIRSDSDLYTFGFSFKPWVQEPVATAERVMTYLSEVIEDTGIDQHIRYHHRVVSADWSSQDALWTLTVKNDHESFVFQTRFLWMCQGYYRHAQGYTPDWEGMDEFSGQIVHPQNWPEKLNYSGKNVAIIGSGATTATLVPAIADKTSHITVIQRSPTYFNPGKNADELADQLRALEIDEFWIHTIVRKKLLKEQKDRIYRAASEPDAVAKEMIDVARAHLGQDVDVVTHFTPRYRPWQQRVAFIPDGDFFESFRKGEASIVTGEIDRFTPLGVRLRSGEEVSADIVITATGFDLCILGDIEFHIDGKPLNFADTVTYQGMMFTDIPNLVWVFGYFRASWTLRVEMIAEVMCRLLNHMDQTDMRKVTVKVPDELSHLTKLSWVDEENFNPGYLKRSVHLMPKRLDVPEWQHTQDYWAEKPRFAEIDVTGDVFCYE